MGWTFRCKHCGRIVARNPRIKSGQRYCRLPGCQAARKNAWRLDKNQKDEGYRKKRSASNKRWRNHHPAHSYHQKYRETHPEYVSKNREKQQKRNEKRKDLHGSAKIVKTDALSLERLINPGFYALSPCKETSDGKIVKSDALMVQLSLIQSNTTFFVQPMTGL